MANSNENSPLLVNTEKQFKDLPPTGSTTEVNCKTYKRRWLVLSVYTAQTVIFNMTLNTWVPIQEPCKIAFGWKDFDLLLISAWTPIAFLLTSVPLTWLMHTKGLRISVLLTAFLAVLGKGFQVIPFGNRKVRNLAINLGQFFLMAGGPVALGAPALVSATWFPVNERTTATAIGTLAGYFGMALTFTVGPAMVPIKIRSNHQNDSHSSSLKSSNLVQELDHKIAIYSCFELGLCTAVLLCALLYFPSRPPLPPSRSSERPATLSTRASLVVLVKDAQFWFLITLCGLCWGVYYGWMSMLAVVLADFSVDSVTAGWLGCGAILAGVLPGIAFARFADFVKRRTKQLLILLLALSMLSQLIFSLSCESILPSTRPILYSSMIFGGFIYTGNVPLFFELTMEHAYPVNEGIAGCILQSMANVITLFFYIAFMLPHSNARWMNWFTVGDLALCTLGLFIYREKYTRLNLDMGIQREPNRVSNA